MSNRILIKSGLVILKDRVVRNGSVLVKGCAISRVGMHDDGEEALIIDASGHYISPGFIDTHIHGDPLNILKNEIRNGTTSIMVAESCAPMREVYKKAENLQKFISKSPLGPSVLGLRLEGPYINPIKAGAQDRRFIRRPDNGKLADIIKRCSPVLKMMTLAPEQKNALSLIRTLTSKGIIASAGHSYAIYEETKKGIAAGIKHATHVFNAMRSMNFRQPGIVGAVLSDNKIFAEIILDLVHVNKASFILLVQMKEPDKVILVTDSVKALTQKKVKYSRGAYRFSDGRLAGSSLTMIKAVRNAVACGIKLPEAVRFATLNPATLLGVQDRKGSITAGKDADIVIFDKKFNIKMVMVRGNIMYRKKGF